MREPLLPSIATDEEYRGIFRDASLGVDAARYVCAHHCLEGEPRRLLEGSNVVFRIGERLWLKMFPSTFGDEGRTEWWMLENVCPQLPVPTPELVACGTIDDWEYVVLTHIDGTPYDRARDRMSPSERASIAADVGQTLRTLHSMSTRAFPRADGLWEPFIDAQIASVGARVAASGADATWTSRAATFVETHAAQLQSQLTRVITHADLYFDHLLVSDTGGRWHVAGVIDFGDAVVAPREYDLVNPLLWLFRGEREPLHAMMEAFGYASVDLDEAFAQRMLAWSVTHRFPRFADAFKNELDDASVASMESLALRLFPIR